MPNDGREGEMLAMRCLRANCFSIEDVSNNPDYWKQDIDLLATDQNGKTYKIEVKWDSNIFYSNNFYFEIYANTKTKEQGWACYTQADVIFYGDVIRKLFYVFSVRDMKHQMQIEYPKIIKEAQDIYKVSAGLVIDKDEFLEKYPHQIIDIEERLGLNKKAASRPL